MAAFDRLRVLEARGRRSRRKYAPRIVLLWLLWCLLLHAILRAVSARDRTDESEAAYRPAGLSRNDAILLSRPRCRHPVFWARKWGQPSCHGSPKREHALRWIPVCSRDFQPSSRN